MMACALCPVGSLAGLELGVVEMLVSVASQWIWVPLPVCRFSFGPVEAEFCFPLPLGWDVQCVAFGSKCRNVLCLLLLLMVQEVAAETGFASSIYI